jgi:hypothetical protein
MVDRLRSLSIPQWLLIAVVAVVAAALMPWFGGHILVLGSLTATVIAVAYASAKHPLFGMVRARSASACSACCFSTSPAIATTSAGIWTTRT